MNIEKIDAPSANITLPLNQSVQQANGAQFALMLSLMMESHSSSVVSSLSAVQPNVASSVNASQSSPNFNLETFQSRALQQKQMHHFHLLHSLYEERVMPVDKALHMAGNHNADMADTVLREIEQGYSANPMLGRESEKVSFAA